MCGISSLYDAAFAMNQLKIYDILNQYKGRKAQQSTVQYNNVYNNIYNIVNINNDTSIETNTYNNKGKVTKPGKGHKVDKKG